jgi:hypothetical protein
VLSTLELIEIVNVTAIRNLLAIELEELYVFCVIVVHNMALQLVVIRTIELH